MGIRLKKKRYVQISASKNFGTTISRREMIKTQICTELTHPGFVKKKKTEADIFTLVVDNFGVKQKVKEHSDHIISVLK